MSKFKVLFVAFPEGGELVAFSGPIEDTRPETVRAALDEYGDGEFKPDDLYDVFIIEGNLTSVGREYLG